MRLAVPRVIDLRDSRLLEQLGLSDAPSCFQSKDVARATASFLRETTPAQGLFVPSVAFLDDPSRWVLALFLDKLPSDPRRFVLAVAAEGRFRVD